MKKLLSWLLILALLAGAVPAAFASGEPSQAATEEPAAPEELEEPETPAAPEESEEPTESEAPEESEEPPEPAFDGEASSGACGDDVTWTLDGGVLTIRGSGDMHDYGATLDEISFSTPWYSRRTEIVSLVVESGVTSLGAHAFNMLISLEQVSLAATVTDVGDCAFCNCTALTSLSLPDAVERIGASAFRDCVALTELNLPASLTEIGDYAFCFSQVQNFVLPEGVTALGRGAFYYGNLKSVTLPTGVTVIEPYTFYGCSGLAYVFYQGTESEWAAVTIGEYNEPLAEAQLRFAGGEASASGGVCGESLTWTLSDDGLLTIRGTGAMTDYRAERAGSSSTVVGSDGTQNNTIVDTPWFDRRWAVREVVIEPGATHIGDRAFYGCFNLRDVSIPDTVRSVGAYAFHGCALEEIAFPDSVTALGASVLSSCVSLTRVTLPPSLETLPGHCFAYCLALRWIDLPESLTRIGERAFVSTGLREVVLPASVRSIGDDAFVNGDIRTLRFQGPLPSGLTAQLAGYIRVIYCPQMFYADYKTLLAQYVGLAHRTSAHLTICGGDTPATLDRTGVTLNADTPTATLNASVEGAAGELSVAWTSADPAFVTVDAGGTLRAVGHGSTLVYAEVTYHGYTTLVTCYVASARNDLLVAALPAAGLTAQPPVTCSASLAGASGVAGYMPAKYVESDTENTYYQELSALVASLTAGCATDTEKAREIHAWVSENISYGGAIGMGDHVDQVYAVYVDRNTRCEGYSKLTGFMLYLAGIPNGIVTNEGHMWNIALLSGRWVMLDSTYGARWFDFDYNDKEHDKITYISFGQGDGCFVVNEAGTVKLAGVGNHELERGGITSVTVPDFVDTLFGYSFAYCENLTSVIIPAGVTAISASAFYHCYALRDVYYAGTTAQWRAITIGDGNRCLTNAVIHTADGTIEPAVVSTPTPTPTPTPAPTPAGSPAASPTAPPATDAPARTEPPDATPGGTAAPSPVPGAKSGSWRRAGDRWWYQYDDGSWPYNTWLTLDGTRYHFGADGYMDTGWLYDSGRWYYLDNSGAMAQNAWRRLGGAWYWFDADGVMAVGAADIGGARYFFDPSGAMVTGWRQSGANWYYYAASGAMARNAWQRLGGTWYWFDADGVMATGRREIGGESYLFRTSGAMAAGWTRVDGNWYYMDGSGAMARNAWRRLGGAWYWFDADGVMATGRREIGGESYLFRTSGAMAVGWTRVDGIWYYMDSSGAMRKNAWLSSGGAWYWFKENGAMAADEIVEIGGRRHSFAASGAWLGTVDGERL